MFIIPWFCTDGSLLSDGLLNLHLSIAIMLSLLELFLVHLIGDYHTIILKSILTVALSLHNNIFSCNHLLSKFSILFQTYHVHWAFNICHELSLFFKSRSVCLSMSSRTGSFPFSLEWAFDCSEPSPIDCILQLDLFSRSCSQSTFVKLWLSQGNCPWLNGNVYSRPVPVLKKPPEGNEIVGKSPLAQIWAGTTRPAAYEANVPGPMIFSQLILSPFIMLDLGIFGDS